MPSKPQLLETTSFDMSRMQPDTQIMASLPVGGLFHHYKDILQDLWLLWELMLLAEPLVVIAPDPGVCSEAVVSLVDLINPVSRLSSSRQRKFTFSAFQMNANTMISFFVYG